MRAWQITKHGEPRDVLALAEVPELVVGDGLVRLSVDASGLGLPDVFLCRGGYAFKPELPFTPGQEVVGRVLESCAGGPAVGTRVMGVTAFFLGKGGCAEQALALASSCFEAPDRLSDEAAAGFCIPYHTAHVGLVLRAGIGPGETLLVTGAAGSSGAAAVSLGKALGARVIALAGGEDKVAFCQSLGADLVLDHTGLDVAAAVEEATAGRGADVIYEVVGGEVFASATRCVGNEGRILAVGFASGAWADASTARLVAKNASVLGVYVGAYSPDQMREAHGTLMVQQANGDIRPVPVRTWPFEALPEALEALAERRILGKGVLVSG